MGDNVIGVSSHVSLIDHLDVGVSVAVAVILLLILACMCACRKGWCLKAILGKHWAHLQIQTPATTSPQQPSAISTSINMTPATAPTSNHVIDTLDEELIILQKRNQIIELQNKRTKLMELTPMSYNPKYPVM